MLEIVAAAVLLRQGFGEFSAALQRFAQAGLEIG